ncbi:MAG: PAS domain-containing sensor histidine kinase [bacterium]
MSLEAIRQIILMTGWPILATGSVLLFFLAYKFYLDVNRVALGKLVMIMTSGWLVTMYSLGVVATLAMFLDVRQGVFVVFPIFLVWAITMVLLSANVFQWSRKTVDINNFYQDIERKYQLIFDISPEAILLLDVNGNVITANKRLEEWVNYRTENILGSKLTGLNFITEKSRELINQNFNRRLKGEILQPYQIEIIARDGSHKYWRVIDTMVHNDKGQPLNSLTMISDVTKQVEIEKLHDDLIHMIVHDLKNPLSAISGTADLFLSGTACQFDEKQKNLVENIDFAAKKMTNLVMDLLQVKQTEENKLVLNKTTFPATELLQNISWLKQYSEKQERRLKAEIPADLMITADKNLVGRILENLLSNAIKHTPANGEINLRIKKDGERINFEVQDAGEGIPKEYLDRIFNKFFKVEGQIQSTKIDTGLGLTFCKMAVEAHGGEIGVASEPGKGSRFYFYLPV